MSKTKPAPKHIRFEAVESALECATIEAAEGSEPKVPTFTMVAYTGGAMNVGGWFLPMVLDLAGTKPAAKTIPAYRGHDPDKAVGHGQAEISANDIRMSGVISFDNEHSRDVVTASRNGFPWQASIGATVEEFETVKKGEKVTVNGRIISGPVNVVRKAMLDEISFVPLGADRRTSAKVAAQFTLAQLHATRNPTKRPVSMAQLHSRRRCDE